MFKNTFIFNGMIFFFSFYVLKFVKRNPTFNQLKPKSMDESTEFEELLFAPFSLWILFFFSETNVWKVKKKKVGCENEKTSFQKYQFCLISYTLTCYLTKVDRPKLAVLSKYCDVNGTSKAHPRIEKEKSERMR